MRSIQELQTMKEQQRSIVMITAYDAPFAQIAEDAGIDMILVGDSLANVVLGLESTQDVGMEEMLVFVKAARRGAMHTHITADMPYRSDLNKESALKNARALVHAGADSVKLEGCKPEIVKEIVANEIPVIGHLGLLPQTATSFKQRGQTEEDAHLILNEAIELAEAGISFLVLEHVKESLGSLVAQRLQGIPVIGIGAGKQVDGQVLVLHDALGIHKKKIPPFAKQYADLYSLAVKGLKDYAQDVNEFVQL